MKLVSRFRRTEARAARRAGPAGQAMVESALVLPLLLLILLGIVDLGRLLALHAAVVTASREGARYAAAVGDNDDGTVPRYVDCDGIRDAVGRTTSALVALSTSQIHISYDDGTGGARSQACPPHGTGPVADEIQNLDRVVVEVSADYQAIVPLIHALVGPISVESSDRRTIVKGEAAP